MRQIISGLLVVAILVTAGCASMNNKEKGALIGATGGAVLGGVIGDSVTGVLIGAAVGGAAGLVIGNYMDKQAEEMQQDLAGAKIERVGEGIKITFESGLLFDVGKADLRPDAQQNLGKLATILNKYEDTNVLIEGHTDADGTDAMNQDLSEHRAAQVAAHLGSQAVDHGRMRTVGYGESRPLADNTTPEGKQRNRRVEVAVWANDKLKKAAEKQAGQG